MNDSQKQQVIIRLYREQAERGRCGKCGETWPCTVVNHPGAYDPTEPSQHYRMETRCQACQLGYHDQCVGETTLGTLPCYCGIGGHQAPQQESPCPR